jgi:hypothetical protein
VGETVGSLVGEKVGLGVGSSREQLSLLVKISPYSIRTESAVSVGSRVYLPTGQCRHSACPLAGWYMPTAHASQEEVREVLVWKKPASHSHSQRPFAGQPGDVVPTGQISQLDVWAVAPSLKRPEGQLVHIPVLWLR